MFVVLADGPNKHHHSVNPDMLGESWLPRLLWKNGFQFPTEFGFAMFCTKKLRHDHHTIWGPTTSTSHRHQPYHVGVFAHPLSTESLHHRIAEPNRLFSAEEIPNPGTPPPISRARQGRPISHLVDRLHSTPVTTGMLMGPTTKSNATGRRHLPSGWRAVCAVAANTIQSTTTQTAAGG